MANLNKDMMRGLSIGIELAVSVLLFAFIGYEVDLMFKTDPFGIVFGVLLGFLGGMWNIYKMVLKDFK